MFTMIQQEIQTCTWNDCPLNKGEQEYKGFATFNRVLWGLLTFGLSELLVRMFENNEKKEQAKHLYWFHNSYYQTWYYNMLEMHEKQKNFRTFMAFVFIAGSLLLTYIVIQIWFPNMIQTY